MGWVVVVLIVVVALAVVSPGFRYFALSAAVLAAGGFYVLLENERKGAEESRKRQAVWGAWSRSTIELKELHFSGVHLKNRSYGPYMALDGVVANNAKHALGEFDVEVTLKDCEDKRKRRTARSLDKPVVLPRQAFRAVKHDLSTLRTYGSTVCRVRCRFVARRSPATPGECSAGVLQRLGLLNRGRSSTSAHRCVSRAFRWRRRANW